MLLRSVFLLLLALAGNASAYEYPIAIWRLSDGSSCRLIFDHKIEKKLQERWSGEGNPPVSVSRAQEIASKWAASEFGPNVQAVITEYQLISLRGEETKTNHWVYVINFVKFQNGVPHPNFQEKLAILMDEKIITRSCSSGAYNK